MQGHHRAEHRLVEETDLISRIVLFLAEMISSSRRMFLNILGHEVLKASHWMTGARASITPIVCSLTLCCLVNVLETPLYWITALSRNL